AELRRPRSDRSCDDAVVLTRDRSHAVLVERIHDRHSLGSTSACVADQQLERASTDTAQPVDVGNSKLESSLEMAPRFKKTRARQRHHAAYPNRSIGCGHHEPILSARVRQAVEKDSRTGG